MSLKPAQLPPVRGSGQSLTTRTLTFRTKQRGMLSSMRGWWDSLPQQTAESENVNSQSVPRGSSPCGSSGKRVGSRPGGEGWLGSGMLPMLPSAPLPGSGLASLSPSPPAVGGPLECPGCALGVSARPLSCINPNAHKQTRALAGQAWGTQGRVSRKEWGSGEALQREGGAGAALLE